jgi:predicted nuclease with TOPRIM domain
MPSGLPTGELLYRRLLDHVEYETVFGVQDLDAYSSIPAAKFSTGLPNVMSLPEHSGSFLGRMRYRFVVQIMPIFGLTTNNSLQRAYAVYHDALQQVTQLSNSRDQLASMLQKTAEARDNLTGELELLQSERIAQNEVFEQIAKNELEKLRQELVLLEARLREGGEGLESLRVALAEREQSLRRAQQALTQRDQIILEYQQLSIERDRALNDLLKMLASTTNLTETKHHA